MTKRKKRDPLAELRRKHPGPWKVKFLQYYWIPSTVPWAVISTDADGTILFLCRDENSARAIAKLGGGK